MRQPEWGSVGVLKFLPLVVVLGAAVQEVSSSRATPRFSDFEVDLRAGELRKQGVKVKLQEQPFQILQVLLEHPGEVVTRRLRPWPLQRHQTPARSLGRHRGHPALHRDPAQARLSFHGNGGWEWQFWRCANAAGACCRHTESTRCSGAGSACCTRAESTQRPRHRHKMCIVEPSA